MLRIILAALVLIALASNASARQRTSVLHPDCNITMPCEIRQAPRQARAGRVLRQAERTAPRRTERPQRAARVSRPASAAPAPTIAGYIEHTVVRPIQNAVRAVGRSVSLAGVVPTLAAKAREIQQSCGSAVISAVRHTYIRGTRRISLHASGHAVDMAGNPACIYERLRGWSGGYSVDYARVKHVHISLAEASGREMGSRFRHGGGRKKARRAAYASARER